MGVRPGAAHRNVPVSWPVSVASAGISPLAEKRIRGLKGTGHRTCPDWVKGHQSPRWEDQMRDPEGVAKPQGCRPRLKASFRPCYLAEGTTDGELGSFVST